MVKLEGWLKPLLRIVTMNVRIVDGEWRVSLYYKGLVRATGKCPVDNDLAVAVRGAIVQMHQRGWFVPKAYATLIREDGNKK
jgi:hypothetical protein